MKFEKLGSSRICAAHGQHNETASLYLMNFGRALSCMLTISLALFASTCAGAVDIKTVETPDTSVTTIMLTGKIEAGDGLKIRGYIGELPRSKPIALWLAFGGGVRSEAMSIGRFVNQAGIRTVVPKNARCIAPCPLVLVAGSDPLTKKHSYLKYSSAKLGFGGLVFNYKDKIYTVRDLDSAVAWMQRDILQIADYLQAIGARLDMLRYYESVLKRGEVRYLSNEEALDLGIPILVEDTGRVIEPYVVQKF